MPHVGNSGVSGGGSPGDQGCFKQLFDLSPDPAWIIDGNRFVDCNEAAIKTLGYPSRDELLNVHPAKLSPARQPDGEDSYVKAERMMAIAKDKGLHRFEWIHTRANGTDFVTEVTLAAIQLLDRPVIYCVCRDISERKQTEQQIRQQAERLTTTLESITDAFFTVDQQWRFTFLNREAERLLERTRAELTGRDFWTEFPGTIGSTFEREYRRAMVDNKTADFEEFYPPLNTWFGVRAYPSEQGLAVYFRDITDAKRIEQEIEFKNAVLQTQQDTSLDGILVVGEDGQIISYNQQFVELWRLSPQLVSARMDAPVLQSVADQVGNSAAFVDRVQYLYEHRENKSREEISLKDGRVIDQYSAPVTGADRKYYGRVWYFRDITTRKQMEEQVRELAFYDPLTHLPNRRLMGDRLNQLLAESKRSNRYGALLFLDLDNFKALNDKHGHGVGDLLLVQAAKRMKSCVREVDTVARFGGDEFVVMMGGLNEDKAASTAFAGSAAEKIRAALAEPYSLAITHGSPVDALIEHRCTASIGVVVVIDCEGTHDDFLRLADTAMYQAKKAGGNLIRLSEATSKS